MLRATTIAQLRDAVADHRAAGARVALVPTLGALHEGHLSNVGLAHHHADVVVVSIYVNPTQFDRPDDLAAYPRDLEGDEATLADLGQAAPHIVFAPSDDQMYPQPPATTVHVAGVTERLEGASRPGHFDGVATVVTKLLNIVDPDVAVFGRKDAQQNRVISRLVADLDLPVALVFTPTVREYDGVALSSRNRRLSPDERRDATALVRALVAAIELARDARARGVPLVIAEVLAALQVALDAAPLARPDYLEVVDPLSLLPPETDAVAPSTRLLVLLAVDVGPVRLIDNVELGDLDDEDAVLQAVDREV